MGLSLKLPCPCAREVFTAKQEAGSPLSLGMMEMPLSQTPADAVEWGSLQVQPTCCHVCCFCSGFRMFGLGCLINQICFSSFK